MTARMVKDRVELPHDPGPVAADDQPLAAGSPAEAPYVEPEQYSLRVGAAAEAVRMEPAEFLATSRVQQSSRRRLARVMSRMREQIGTEGGA